MINLSYTYYSIVISQPILNQYQYYHPVSIPKKPTSTIQPLSHSLTQLNDCRTPLTYTRFFPQHCPHPTQFPLQHSPRRIETTVNTLLYLQHTTTNQNFFSFRPKLDEGEGEKNALSIIHWLGSILIEVQRSFSNLCIRAWPRQIRNQKQSQ